MNTGSGEAGNKYFAFIARHPRAILVAALLVSVLAVLYTKSSITFLTGRNDLMPAGTSFNRDYERYRSEFGDQEEIAIVIEADDSALCGDFGTKLHARLAAKPKVFRETFFPFGLPFFRNNGLLFMPTSDLEALLHNLTLAKPVLKELAASPSVQTLFTALTAEIDGYLAAPAAPGARQRLDGIVFMLNALKTGFTAFDGTGKPPSMEDFFFSTGDGKESSFRSAGKMQILTALPVKDGASFVPAEEAVRVIRADIAALKKDPRFKNVKVGLTGTPVLEYEEMATSQDDIALATVVSLVLTVILLLLAFRGIINVIAAMVTLVVAICLSFGFATLAVGHLNILSMVFAIMLIGIGIEYGIQLVLRYQEERGAGRDEMTAIRRGLTRNVWAIVMAAATVAAAFLTFVFTDFRGIAELGIIAAGGIAICVAVTFTVLPAMLVLLARWRRAVPPPKERAGTHPAVLRVFSRPKFILALTATGCLVCIYPLVRTSFDYNLMNLQAKGLESVEYAYKLMRSKENAGYFAVVVADGPADAAAKTKRLEALPTVDHVVSAASFVPDDQEKKLAILGALRKELDDVRPVPYEENLQLMALPTVFENFRTSVDRLTKGLAAEGRPEAKPAGAFLAVLDRFFGKLEKEKDRNAVGMLQDFQGEMFAAFPEQIRMLKESLAASPVTAADVPRELTSRFIGKNGKYQLQVAPKHEIFDREPLEAFLADVRKVDPHATGEPVMVYESMTVMRDAYLKAFVYAFVAIVGILLVTFRSVKFAIIGLIPLVVGILFMVGGMRLFGIRFNSANIIVMPLVLGIAVDSGIYLVNRFRREDETAVEVITSSTGQGVIYNTLTIMASFGALMVAHHQGVFSIGAVMSLGMIACQVAFMLVLPAVLSLVGKR